MSGAERFMEDAALFGLRAERRGEIVVVMLPEDEGLPGEAGADPPADFPNVPPHWIHLPEAIALPDGGGQASELGAGWRKWSRPHPKWLGGETAFRQWLAHVRSLLPDVGAA